MSNDRKFAFGKNRIEDVCCPAVAAGVDPDNMAELARRYDEVARDMVDPHGSPTGVIGEHTARSAWTRALMFCVDRYGPDSEYVQRGRKVARELEWEVPEAAQP